jgi:hypothetical protein
MNKIASLILISLAFQACEAPRDNPLDPDSDEFSFIEGSVQSFSIPYTPLRDVTVYWPPSGTMVRTDSQGVFRISNAKISDGYLIFQKSGYRTDSVFLQWFSGRKISLQHNLNKIPVMDSSFIFTSVLNHADDSRTFEVLSRAKISDDDKDIDSVFLESIPLKVKKYMTYDLNSKYYETSLASDEIPVNDIEETIGKEFSFSARDIFSYLYPLGKNYVSRVIRTGATIVSPESNSVVDSLPLLTWKRYQPGYTHTYTVELYKSDPVNPQLISRVTDLPMSNSSFKVTTRLNPGNYFWVIWTIDSFRNSSRSKPAPFIVR